MDITVTSTIYGFGTTPTTNETSVTYNGVTFTFDTAMPVGYFESGEPFVVSSSAFNITAISPASAVVDTYQAHGAMQDPLLGASSDGDGGPQGFDEMLSTSGISALNASVIPYSASLNVDPAVSGSIAISQGQETSIVKSVRLSGATNSDWHSLEKYVTLTALSAAPTTGAIRPAPSALTKAVYNLNDINLSVVRDLTMPGSFSESATTSLSYIPDHLGNWGSEGGERTRRLRLDEGLHGGGTSNYSGVLTPYYARAILQLHNAATPKAKKYEIASLVIRHGTQIAALHGRGADLFSGAGQGGGIHLWVWAAAFLLKDASLLSAAQAMDTQLLQPEWIVSGGTTRTPVTRSTESPQPAFAEMVGQPIMPSVGFTTNIDTPYINSGSSNVYWEAISLMPFYNFGGDWTANFVNGAYDTTNDRAAVIALTDRVRTWDSIFNAYNVPAQWKDIYDVVRPYSVMTSWTGRPEQMPYGQPQSTSYDDDYFTAGDGQISWDFLGLDFATETVTQRDFRYSLDRIQWIVESDVATTGTKTGLLKGMPHWCGLRQQSASGAGAWSANFPHLTPINSGSDRGKRTTTGTDSAAAPVNTVAPKIHVRINEQWADSAGNEWKDWEEATSPLSADASAFLACGNGYWTGYDAAPPMTFTYQWKRDGSPIGGATSQEYQRVQADAGTVLTCEITATNTSGSASVTTAGITMPALATIPAGTLIDTNFRSSFLLDYESEWGSVVTSAANAALKVGYAGTGEDDSGGLINYGAFHCDKTSQRPNIRFTLSRPLTAGSSYRVQAQLHAPSTGASSVVWDHDYMRFDIAYTGANLSYLDQGAVDFNVSPWLQVLETSLTPQTDGTTTFNEATYRGTVTVTDYIIDVDITFDVAPGETSLYPDVYFGTYDGTGGASGGDVFLHYLKISEVV